MKYSDDRNLQLPISWLNLLVTSRDTELWNKVSTGGQFLLFVLTRLVLQAAGGMADLSDYIRGGAFVLLFLVTGLRDLNTWLLADLIFTGVTGFLLYVNPFWTMNLQVNIEGSRLVIVKR